MKEKTWIRLESTETEAWKTTHVIVYCTVLPMINYEFKNLQIYLFGLKDYLSTCVTHWFSDCSLYHLTESVNTC